MSKIVQDEIQRYEKRGFKLTAIHANNSFDNKQMRAAIDPRLLHIYAL